MSKKWELYEVSENTLLRKNKFCPRCGEGIFMAEHKNRFSCGSCGYTEWKEKSGAPEPGPKQKDEPSKSPKKEAVEKKETPAKDKPQKEK
ncbi:MAG: 30S ribosomal protein S27ae [Candidatus Hydrothermarchaeaceae archaeon]